MEDTEVNKHSNPLRRVYELVRSRYLFKIGMAVLVVTVLLAGAGYAAYAQTQSEVRADADDKLMDFANLEAQGLDGFIRDHEQKAADLSRRPVFMSGDEGDIRSQLQAVKSISPDYVTEIHYYNTETDTVEVSSEKRIEGKQLDENDRPWAVDTDAFDRTGEARSFEPYEEEGNRELGFASPVLGNEEYLAVVADEVKELAEETADATQEIETLIETVETSTDSVADDMFEMRDDIQMGRETVDGTVETLESIVTEIRDANDGIQSINVATDEQADSTQEVVAMVEDVASVSEQTAEEAQTVSAAAEEQTSAIEQIASSADSLSERADELRSLVDGFETQAGASAGETDLGEGDAVSADGGPHATDGGPGSDDDTTPDERT